MQSEYIEARNGGYYVAGTRISLDFVVCSFKRGNSPEAIQDSFPRLKRSHGAIAFYRDHQPEIDEYLASRNASSSRVLSRWPRPVQPYGKDSIGPVSDLVNQFLEPSLSGGCSPGFCHCQAVRRQEPAIDFASANDSALDRIDDSEVLERANHDSRILITHDYKTMLSHFRERLHGDFKT